MQTNINHNGNRTHFQPLHRKMNRMYLWRFISIIFIVLFASLLTVRFFLYIIVPRMRNTKTFHVAYSVCKYIHFRIYNLFNVLYLNWLFYVVVNELFLFFRILMLIERNGKYPFDILANDFAHNFFLWQIIFL